MSKPNKKNRLLRVDEFRVMAFLSQIKTGDLTFKEVIDMIKEQLKLEVSQGSVSAMVDELKMPVPRNSRSLHSKNTDRPRSLAMALRDWIEGELSQAMGKQLKCPQRILDIAQSTSKVDGKEDKPDADS
jgi:hypothetical protein